MAICEKFADATKKEMVHIVNTGARRRIEMGATIKPDYTLGEIVAGEPHSIIINRAGAIGAHHVHPYAGVEMSEADIIEMAKYESQVECIGAHVGHGKPKITCYQPADPLHFKFFFAPKVKELFEEISVYSAGIIAKYGKIDAKQDSIDEGIGRALIRRRKSLSNEITQIKDKLVSSCELVKP